MSQQNKTDSHALPYCLLPDVSTANASCIKMIEETTQHVIASVEVITATKGVLIDAALRTAAEAITSRPISAGKVAKDFPIRFGPRLALLQTRHF